MDAATEASLPHSVLEASPPRSALTFGEFVQERDRCRDPKYRSDHMLLREAFFCNTNRLWDTVSREIEDEIELHTKLHKIKVLVISRFTGSPRNDEGGSKAIARAVRRKGVKKLREWVTTMRCTGRKTYRAVYSRQELAIMLDDVCLELASVDESASLHALAAKVRETFKMAAEKHDELRMLKKQNTHRKCSFHSVQLACDLFAMGIIDVKDQSDCPLAKGSRAGLKHVRRREGNTTLKELAVQNKRQAHEIQTSLCEYDKYVRWSGGQPFRKRGCSTLAAATART